MQDSDVKPESSIDKFVMPYIESLPSLEGKVAVDIPSGEGRASYVFAKRGADVRAFDLYPEFTTVEGVNTEFADLNDRIPLDDASSIGGITDWTIVKAARVWFEDLPIDEGHVLIGSMDIVGNQWEPEPIRSADGTPVPEEELQLGESFRVKTKNTKEDADYVPPFDPGVDEDTNLPKREQSLALLVENLAPGHEAAARKLLFSEENYTRYGALEFYVHGEQGVEEGTSFFLRVGADSLNYYEYSLELREGWLQDLSADRNRLHESILAR